jgi:hypothetical protein
MLAAALQTAPFSTLASANQILTRDLDLTILVT